MRFVSPYSRLNAGYVPKHVIANDTGGVRRNS